MLFKNAVSQDFREFVKLLGQNGVRYMVVGGVMKMMFF